MARLFSRQKLVYVGGGGGSYLFGKSLRGYDEVDLTLISSPVDSGGSSGRIRNELGKALPPGDRRQGLMSLMPSVQDEEYFGHRFEDEGSGIDELTDHSLGNIMLTAAEKRFGPDEGTAYIAKLFGVRHTVLSMSNDSVHLVAKLSDESILKGETNIDRRPLDDERLIIHEWLEPPAFISHKAAEAIRNADGIIMGASDPRTSTIPSLLVRGAQEAFEQSNAVFICLVNQMDKWGETRGFTPADFVKTLLDYGIGGRKKFDAVIINSTPIPQDVLDKYWSEEKSRPILLNTPKDMANLRDFTTYVQPVDLLSSAGLQKRLIRHDPAKVGQEIMKLMVRRDWSHFADDLNLKLDRDAMPRRHEAPQ